MGLITSQQFCELEKICRGGTIRDANLAALSRWHIGGSADLLLRPTSTREVACLREFFHRHKMPHVVVGLTSNLLFSDDGLRVPCVQIGPRMSALQINAEHVWAQAGNWVPALARRLMQAELTGGEHICGIPGTLGGLICMNGGSQRKGIGSSVVKVQSVDDTGKIRQRTAAACEFAYRHSIFQSNREIITAAHLRFEPGDRSRVRLGMRGILAERRKKFPRKLPNCGSVFKSEPAMYSEVGPPGAVIERLGFKGLRLGDAMVSALHANFIVNCGRARAADVLALIALIAEAVQEATGYRMEAEALYVQPNGRIVPADCVLLVDSSAADLLCSVKS